MNSQNNIDGGFKMATIFCDTDSELWYTHAREFDINVIRMPYTIDGVEDFSDLGEEFDSHAFFTRMRNGAKAFTSALNEEIYYNTFKPYYEKGEDILYIAFSSKMSGTFQSLDLALARLDKEHPGVKFRRFDTLNICMGAGILVYLGAKYFREHNNDIDATYAYLESIRDKVGVYFVVEDMKYLARGGRISPAKAKIANLMNIKPVLTVKEDGTLDVGSKQNGLKKAYNYMMDEFKNKYKQIDGAAVTIVDADNKAAADDIERRVLEFAPDATIWRQPVGPVVGVHAGPGTIGLIFTTK